MRILIAEDTPTIRMVHAAAMKKWGFHYDLAANGAEAVDCAKRNDGHYDLCIMDVAMPVMDGVAATRVIRSEVSYLPILGYSTDAHMRNPCLASGMDEFLRKPCPPDRLLAIIEELTHKPLLAKVGPEGISISKVMPCCASELKTLRELKKRELTTLRLNGLDRCLVVHNNIQEIARGAIADATTELIAMSAVEAGRFRCTSGA